MTEPWEELVGAIIRQSMQDIFKKEPTPRASRNTIKKYAKDLKDAMRFFDSDMFELTGLNFEYLWAVWCKKSNIYGRITEWKGEK